MVFLKGEQSRKYFLAIVVLLNGKRMGLGEEERMLFLRPVAAVFQTVSNSNSNTPSLFNFLRLYSEFTSRIITFFFMPVLQVGFRTLTASPSSSTSTQI